MSHSSESRFLPRLGTHRRRAHATALNSADGHDGSERVDRLDRLWTYLGHGLHILVAILVVVVIVKQGMDWRIVLFILLYISGAWVRPRWLWFVAVVVAWALMVAVWPSASFIAFALFFLAIGMLPPKVGVPVVGVLTVITVVAIARFNGFEIGGVIGPVVGALVAVALGLGFRMLRREARARAEASHHAGEMGERARVAADIHDTVAQGLSSIHMLLFSVERRLSPLLSDATTQSPAEDLSRAIEEIRLARKTTEENLAETRRIIAALQPAPLEQADLTVALARVVSTTPMGKSFTLSVDGQAYPLRADVQEAIVRMTQSLVSNVVRHAHASAARVTLTYQEDQVSLDVVDNGTGFDVNWDAVNQDSTLGLAGVRRRAMGVGGTMTIESEPGEGCGVAICIPAYRAVDRASGGDSGGGNAGDTAKVVKGAHDLSESDETARVSEKNKSNKTNEVSEPKKTKGRGA